MRKRHYRARVWLNENEHEQLLKDIVSTGLSQETYLRKLITGTRPKEIPPIEYREMIRQLAAIGHNMNQIAARLNSLGIFDTSEYQKNVQDLTSGILEIQKMYEL